ncbi:hypothetical protein EYZ11_004495 [Aspergillus tanneri]|uniref:Uncharacterized protein n=1 Tax=Aspergillus tanneri TaxID=1220188 RepID=A0A4S3JKX1_9EURO|nr:hypothetical protein EYZ11_004495 [Aspergillus tanneri]
MALDVELFVRSHRLHRGAKTALTLALHLPDLISKVIAVDNGPVHLPLSEDFPRYLKGMAEIKNAQVKTHLEADMILRNYAEARSPFLLLFTRGFVLIA